MGFYLPVIAEFAGVCGQSLANVLQKTMQDTWLQGMLWSQCYIIKKGRVMSHFDAKAATWDENPTRRKLAMDVGRLLLHRLELSSEKVVMDLGCGTGLIALQLSPKVAELVAIDTSSGMLDVLRDKVASGDFGAVTICNQELTSEKGLGRTVDIIVSTMALHHVEDVPAMARIFYDHLNPGGQLAIVDLDLEDGTFHTSGEPVPHDGFDRKALSGILDGAGFTVESVTDATVLPRETESGAIRDFSLFLLLAKKQG